MIENYTPQEQEYDEIFMILHMYHEKYPLAIKEIDSKKFESINFDNQKLTAIINLHWQLFSLSDSVIMMNTNRNYRGASIILRNMMEITLLIQYFDKYPDEARRWNDYQRILINKKMGYPFNSRSISSENQSINWFHVLGSINWFHVLG